MFLVINRDPQIDKQMSFSDTEVLELQKGTPKALYEEQSSLADTGTGRTRNLVLSLTNYHLPNWLKTMPTNIQCRQRKLVSFNLLLLTEKTEYQ